MSKYVFTSERLGFRKWDLQDLDSLIALNNDDDVMEFFPYKPSRQNTQDFIARMNTMYDLKKFCYFAVDILENHEFIGFIGLCEQTYLKKLNPFVDIGWRLKKSSWNQGYATEGALACLHFGFNIIGLEKIYSVAPEINKKSELIMKKIGMEWVEIFEHPKLIEYPNLKSCVLYKTTNQSL